MPTIKVIAVFIVSLFLPLVVFADSPDKAVIFRQIKWKKFLDGKPSQTTWKQFLLNGFDPEAMEGIRTIGGLDPFNDVLKSEEYVYFLHDKPQYFYVATGKFEPKKFMDSFDRVLRNYLRITNYEKLEYKNKFFYVVAGAPVASRFCYLYFAGPDKHTFN